MGVPQDVKRDRQCNARLCLATLRRAVPEDSDVIFERLRAEGFDATYLVPNPLAFANQSRIGELGSSHRIATVGDYPSFARNGILPARRRVDRMRRKVPAFEKALSALAPTLLRVQKPRRSDARLFTIGRSLDHLQYPALGLAQIPWRLVHKRR